MWKMMAALGFDLKAGTAQRPAHMLENGAGIGNFRGLAPVDMRLDMVEIDPITARIAHLLYPEEAVYNIGFQDNMRSGYDGFAGNVPFGDFTVPLRKTDPLHPANKPRAAGVDISKPSIHFYVGAIRLPASTFEKNASTSVTTDILFFRKRYADEKFELQQEFINSDKTELPKDRDRGAEEALCGSPSICFQSAAYARLAASGTASRAKF